MDFKNIQIGQIIQERVLECEISTSHISKIFDIPEDEVESMYSLKSLNCQMLLRWSKLLEYDFFRMYSQHLILYAPTAIVYHKTDKKIALQKFKKNVYTKEIIDFILEMIETGEKTKVQIIEEYRIPKTTLYKWLSKYKKS